MIGADGLMAASNKQADADAVDGHIVTAPMRYEVEAHEWHVEGTTTRITYTCPVLEFRHGGVVLTGYTWVRPHGRTGASDGSVFLPYDRIVRVLMDGAG